MFTAPVSAGTRFTGARAIPAVSAAALVGEAFLRGRRSSFSHRCAHCHRVHRRGLRSCLNWLFLEERNDRAHHERHSGSPTYSLDLTGAKYEMIRRLATVPSALRCKLASLLQKSYRTEAMAQYEMARRLVAPACPHGDREIVAESAGG
jgi:hypothetical protein